MSGKDDKYKEKKEDAKNTASGDEDNRVEATPATGDEPLIGKPACESVTDEEKKACREGGVPNIEMSDELRAALEEAEQAVLAAAKAAPAEGASEEGDEDLEIEVETEEAREKKEGEKKFDPNAVEESPAEVEVERPSQKEMELKMQVLDLRGRLREKEVEVEKKIKELRQNADEAKRLRKQFDDFKVRVQKERADRFNYGHEELLRELLVVIDNLELAMRHAGDVPEAGGLKEGVNLTLKQFLSVLERFGVVPLEPRGELFNPEYHEAMSQAVDNTVPPNTVVELHQKGYMLKDRLLRPAKVVVSRHAEPEAPAAESGTESKEGQAAAKGPSDGGAGQAE